MEQIISESTDQMVNTYVNYIYPSYYNINP